MAAAAIAARNNRRKRGQSGEQVSAEREKAAMEQQLFWAEVKRHAHLCEFTTLCVLTPMPQVAHANHIDSVLSDLMIDRLHDGKLSMRMRLKEDALSLGSTLSGLTRSRCCSTSTM